MSGIDESDIEKLEQVARTLREELNRDDKTLEDLALLMAHNSIDSAITLLVEHCEDDG